MAQRVGVCKSGGEGKTFRTLETHVELEGETKKEKSPTCCVELNQRLQILQNKNEELRKKCGAKAAENRDLEAHSSLVKEENRKLKQELKKKEVEIRRIKTGKPKSGMLWSELQQKKDELAELQSEPCSKSCCKENEKELQRLKEELTDLKEEPCMKKGCYRVRTEKSTLTIQLEEFKRERQRSYADQDNQLQQQITKFRERVSEISREVQALREDKKMLKMEVEAKDAQLQETNNQIKELHALREEHRKLQEKVEENKTQLQERDAQISQQQRELDALREEGRMLQVKVEGGNAQLQEKDTRVQQQDRELREKAIQISRQQRELQTQKEEWNTQLQGWNTQLQGWNTQIQQQGTELHMRATHIRRLQTELQQMEENKAQQQRILSEKEAENERLQRVLQQKTYDYTNQQARLQSDFELKKERILEDSRVERERMLSEKKELTREVERLTTLTCKGRDCPTVYFQMMTGDILETIGKVENKKTGERLSLGDVLTSLASGQTSLNKQLQEIRKEQQQFLLQRSCQSCAECSEKDKQYSRLKEAHLKLQRQNQDYSIVTRRHEKTIQELEKQLHSGQCQRPDCVKLRKEQRQKEVQLIGNMGSPGKDLDKQRVVEHDQLIHEFERLTTDPDGLLGVLEDTLQEHGDDANFEAKRLLCGLFQESYDYCKKGVLIEIKTQLESLFKVQSTPKSEEMEDASRGYGLLLHAFGLRTEEIKAKYSTLIKGKIYSEISKDESLHKVKDTLESSREDHFGKAITLAWKFVTLPNPLIVCQPKGFNNHTHSPEFGHWEKHAKEYELIYTRPVIYRNYEGMLACKGWVANTVTSDRKSKCLLS